MTVSCLVARSSCFSLNLLVFLLYGGVFFRRMSETDDESQHFGHLTGARHAPTKPRFLTFWCGKRIFAHYALCLGAPPVVNNPGNSVAAGKVRLLKRSSEHKFTMNRQRDGFVLWAIRRIMRKFAYFCLPNAVVSCETTQIAVFRRPTHACKTNGKERCSKRTQGIFKHCHTD